MLPVKQRCVWGGIEWEEDTSFSWFMLGNGQIELCAEAAAWLAELLSFVDSITQSVTFLMPTSFFRYSTAYQPRLCHPLCSTVKPMNSAALDFLTVLCCCWNEDWLFCRGYGVRGVGENRLQVSRGKLGCPEMRICRWIQTVQSTFGYLCTVQLKHWSVPPVAPCWWNHRGSRLRGLFMHSAHIKMDEADDI